MPDGSPGAGTVSWFILEIVPGRMVIKPDSVAFPENLRLRSFNKVFILLKQYLWFATKSFEMNERIMESLHCQHKLDV